MTTENMPHGPTVHAAASHMASPQMVIYWGLVFAQVLGLGTVFAFLVIVQLNANSQGIQQWKAIHENQAALLHIQQSLDGLVSENHKAITDLLDNQNKLFKNHDSMLKIMRRVDKTVRHGAEPLPMPKPEEEAEARKEP